MVKELSFRDPSALPVTSAMCFERQRFRHASRNELNQFNFPDSLVRLQQFVATYRFAQDHNKGNTGHYENQNHEAMNWISCAHLALCSLGLEHRKMIDSGLELIVDRTFKLRQIVERLVSIPIERDIRRQVPEHEGQRCDECQQLSVKVRRTKTQNGR